jgi:carboxylesterase type B
MTEFDPRNLVASQGDMIVVTFNYRGTIFGFPNSPALPIDQQNLGIRDHRAALEWLRDNLASFGGDPDQITVGGQSSGADSWAALAYTYPNDYIARGLLLESGHPLAAEPSGDPSEEFHRIAGVVGCRNKSDSAEELRCMKTIPAQTLRDAISPNFINMFAVPNGGTPMIDNITLFTPDEYLKRGNAGRFAKVVCMQCFTSLNRFQLADMLQPVFMGMNDQEGDGVENWSAKCGINQTFSNIITLSFFECPLTLEAS